MAVNSSEILLDEQQVEPKPKREMAPLNKLAVESTKVVGKGALGTAKLGGSGLLKFVRWVGRNKRDLGMIGATAATTASVILPEKAVDVSKNVISGSIDAIHNPKGAVGSATTEAGQVLLNAADAAISKAQKSGLDQLVGIEPITADGTMKTDFGFITPEQKNLIDIAISNEKKNLDLSMTPEDWANVFKYEGLVKEIAGKRGVDGNDLLKLVVLESHGNPYAESSVGAAGLTQQMPKFAEQFGLKVVYDDDPNIQGLTPDEIREYRIANDERYNPEKNLDATAQSIADNILKFKDKRIVYQVHHGGDRLIWQAVGDFVYKRYGYKLPYPIDVNIGSDDTNYNETIRRLGENQEAILGTNRFADGKEKPIGIVDLYSTGLLGSDDGDRYAYLMSGAGQLIVEKRPSFPQETSN